MAARPLVYYLPLIPIGCIICMIVGVGVWSHYTVEVLNQAQYALDVAGPNLRAPNLDRGLKAVEGTSTSYMLFACALFGLGLYRKLLSAEHDLGAPKPRHLALYRATNAGIHFVWWLIMQWIVVLMMGIAVLSILIWVGNHAVQRVLANQATVSPLYVRWGQRSVPSLNLTVSSGQLAVAHGDLPLAVLVAGGWPVAETCPATCLSLWLFEFVQTDAAGSCVCNGETLSLLMEATRAALDAVPGMLVGIWFMYVFGELFKTSLACDFTSATRDLEGDGGSATIGRGTQGAGRGYTKL